MSIADKAMLVNLSISQWYNRITDRKVTAEVAEKYEVSRQEDRYIKTLLPREAVKHIEQTISRIRSFHVMNTLPWQDNNIRILSSKNFFQYQQGIATRRADMETTVEKFIQEYPAWITRARETKKLLFDEAQYPSAEAIKNHFKVDIKFLPFPNISDFRVDLPQSEMDQIKAQTEMELNKALASANQHLIKQLHEKVAAAYEVLKVPDKIFRKNTLEAVLETADLVEALNVTNHRVVNRSVNAIRDAFLVFPDAASLRLSPELRSRSANRLGELLTSLEYLESLESLERSDD